MANTIWGRLWESTEGDIVTVRLPRALAEELLAAISAGCESGDGLDMGGDDDDDSGDDDSIELDMGGDDGGGDEDGPDLLLVGDDDDEEDEDDDKDEAYAKSGGSPSGMRPKTAFGEGRSSFGKLKGKIRSAKRG